MTSLIEELQEKATYINYATDGQKVIYLSKTEFAAYIIEECANLWARKGNNIGYTDFFDHFKIKYPDQK
jgi:hypothetical protein